MIPIPGKPQKIKTEHDDISKDGNTRTRIYWKPQSVAFDDVTFTWWSTVQQETIVESQDSSGAWHVIKHDFEEIVRPSTDFPADMIDPYDQTSDAHHQHGLTPQQSSYLQGINTLEGIKSLVSFDPTTDFSTIVHNGTYILALPSGRGARNVILDFHSDSYDVYDDQRRFITTVTMGSVIDGATANAMLHTNEYDVGKEYMVVGLSPVSWLDGSKHRNDTPTTYSVNFRRNASGSYAPRTEISIALTEYCVVEEAPTEDKWYQAPNNYNSVWLPSQVGQTEGHVTDHFSVTFDNPAYFANSVVASIKKREDYKPDNIKRDDAKEDTNPATNGTLDMINALLDPVGFLISGAIASVSGGSGGWLSNVWKWIHG